MAKSNKQSYEKKWQEVFGEAEVRPSAQLWKNIESDLNAAENAKFKRRLLFYRAVAAAAVACVVVLGIYTWGNQFMLPAGDEQKITAVEKQNNPSSVNSLPEKETATEGKGPESLENKTNPAGASFPLAEKQTDSKVNSEEDKTSDKKTYTTSGSDKINSPSFYAPLAGNQAASADEKKNTAELSHSPSPENSSFDDKRASSPVLLASQGIADGANGNLNKPVAAIYPIPVMPKKKKEDFQPTFFAGLNLSTDYFNPNYNAPSSQASLEPASFADLSSDAVYLLSDTRTNSLSKNDLNPGNLGVENTAQLSFSYGANFGVALSKHWSIESGVGYSKYNTSSQTLVSFQGISTDEAYPLSVANNDNESSRQFSSVRYEPTRLTNTFDFVAVPVKIGYNLSFNRINVVFGTGVAANFLLQNNISDDAGRLNEVTIRADESSPFRSVYYSGILSSGIHYQLMEKYAFSITPSYNFSISALTKSESNFMSQPYTFGVDFGVRYMF